METFLKNVNSLLDLGGRQEMNLHIEQIHGINTLVVLVLTEDTARINITLTDFESEMDIILEYKYDDEDFYRTYILDSTITHPMKFGEAVQDVLRNIQFDKFSGKMYSSTNRIIPFIERCENSYLQDIFGFDHIKFDFEKCSVCLISTETKTRCHHALCYVCWTEILKTSEACPLCRTSIANR